MFGRITQHSSDSPGHKHGVRSEAGPAKQVRAVDTLRAAFLEVPREKRKQVLLGIILPTKSSFSL